MMEGFIMTIKLLNTSSDENVVNKAYSTIATLSGSQANDEIKIDTPEIIINYDASYLACNYVKIDEFNRFYYVREKSVINGNQLRFSLESDPLMSFKSSILGSQCIAGRSTSHPNMNIVDPLVSFEPIPVRKYTKISTAFTPSASGGSYLLTIGGK